MEMSQSDPAHDTESPVSASSEDAPAETAAQSSTPSGQAPAADALERLRKRNLDPHETRGGADADFPLNLARSKSQADALARLQRLKQGSHARKTSDKASDATSETGAGAASKQSVQHRGTWMPSSRIAKSALALVAAVAIAWVPVRQLLATTSADATINARLINLRAPISGQVSILASSIAVGTKVQPGEPLLHIANTRADRQRLDDMRRTLSNLKAEIRVRDKQLARFNEIRGNAQAQRDAFQLGRVRQLETRQAELEAQLKAAEAHRDDALKSVNRVKSLNAKGYQPTATLLHADRDYKVSLNEVEAANKRLDGNRIEMEAARKGLFVGDSYNDLPRSAQRLDELDQRIADLTGELEQRKARVANLMTELAEETTLFNSRAAANVVATVDGRIWETLTANGEEVRSGQDLLRVLDCGSATVTATVSEPVYNTLWIGQPVEFRLHGDSQRYSGSVAALTGLAVAEANFAIKQTALKREPYHVTIAVPRLAAQQRCNVGRSGQVSFDTSSRAPARAPATPPEPAPAGPKVSASDPPASSVSAADFAGAMRNALGGPVSGSVK